jgi:hypothetical protein
MAAIANRPNGLMNKSRSFASRAARQFMSRPRPAWLACVASLLSAASATGQEEVGPAAAEAPAFLRARAPMPAEFLERKKDGWYLTGFPALGGDSEYGISGGVQVQLYDNGPRESPFFPWTPYRKKFAAGATVASEGREQAFVLMDVPALFDTPWRLRFYGGYVHDEKAPYFGTGTSTLGPLTYPGSTQTYGRYPDYLDALEQVVNGETWARYVRYDRRQWLGSANLEYSLLEGRLRPMLAFQLAHIDVEDYTGQEIGGAIQQPTKLYLDHSRGAITGFEGGWDNSLRFGLAYDTRDYEPDPTRGLLAQFLVSGYVPALGAAQAYGQVTAQITGYQPLVPRHPTRLVLAGNAGYSFKFGDAPFYAMPGLALPSNEIRHGLGGFYTLRGFNSDRFTGKVAAYASTELRWSFAEARFWKQHLKFAVAPFVDAGRVFNNAGDFSLDDWKVSGGAGLRIAWNLATIISLDVGVSGENTMIYAEIGHAF